MVWRLWLYFCITFLKAQNLLPKKFRNKRSITLGFKTSKILLDSRFMPSWEKSTSPTRPCMQEFGTLIGSGRRSIRNFTAPSVRDETGQVNRNSTTGGLQTIAGINLL